jgi:16S rRNA (guanine527-N7)-methyltransferase
VAAVPAPPDRALDLGSGGGVPGLFLALTWPESRWTLLDANERRSTFLVGVVAELGLAGRVDVVNERAEIAARGALRATLDLVVSRSFGAPAVTAECGSPFLHTGGRLVVSEPPNDSSERWPQDGLRALGLVDRGRTGAVRVLEQAEETPDRYPRRVGIPAKRPLWT